jgi:hypothetical protein
MKCPVCEKENQRSRVYPDGDQETCMGYIPYYDEDGHRHVHNRNIRVTSYHCSEGHQWYESTQRACPSFPDHCDFGGKSATTIRGERFEQNNEIELADDDTEVVLLR